MRCKPVAVSCAAAALLLAAVLALPLAAQHRQPDENGMYQQEGYWVQYLGERNEKSADSFVKKVNSLCDTLLTKENNVYCAIVPDKSHYLPDVGWPVLDYDAMASQVQAGLDDSITWVSLADRLTLADYYKTDAHWRQEKLQPVVNALGEAMGFSQDLSGWEQNVFDGFVGSYGKYIPDGAEPETLVYLTSPATEAARVDNFQYPDATAVYDVSKLSGVGSYDVFLNGATPLQTIENPNAATDRELVIFRDSFASSLAPLLCEQYRTITLIDLRYMVSGLVPQYVTFTDQDVLFLFSSWVVNESAMLR